MARTEVKLNSVYYKLKRLPTQVLANQMASKVGQGTSEYGDLTTWSAWIQQDWQEGVGKVKPHLNGGYLYGEVESRVPGQLILPQLMVQVDTVKDSETPQRYMPPNNIGSILVGSGGYDRFAIKFTTPSSLPMTYVWYSVYARLSSTASVAVSIQADSAGSPSGVAINSSSINANDSTSSSFQWVSTQHQANGSLSTSTAYWLVFIPSIGSMNIGYSDDVVTATVPTTKQYSSGAWSTTGLSGKNAMWTSGLHSLEGATDRYGSHFFRFNSILYCVCNNRVWKYDTTDDEWDLVGSITAASSNTTGATVFDSTVYFGRWAGASNNYDTMSTGETFTAPAVVGNVFAKGNGYLWRSQVNKVEYSEDGATWEPTATTGSPITVSDTSEPVTGMCAMGDIMYCSTTAGLVAIYPGDIAKNAVPWGSISEDNGYCMINFEGSLYILVNGRVIRYSEDGSMQDIWMTREDDLINGNIGKVMSMCVSNNWIFAIVSSSSTPYVQPTIWGYQNNAWHFIGQMPTTYLDLTKPYCEYDIYYDRVTNYLWAITPTRVTYRWYLPNTTINPYNDPLSVYQSSGWIEWDWFDGPVLENDKDYESVTVIGENIDDTCPITVYWMDDASTAWELLGVINSNAEELRWTVAMGTRPDTKRFKLGMMLATSDSTQTPRIRAIRVKYHLMVRDWFRWNVIVDVSGRSGAYQMLGDGAVNTLTAAQIKDNLDALAKRTPPFIYQDVDTTQYEVKVTDANFTYDKYEYNESTATEWWEGTYNLQLEQVTNAEYA